MSASSAPSSSPSPSQKILAIGSPQGKLQELTAKIRQFHKKAGPFDCCVILGDVFGAPSSEEGSSDGSELLDDPSVEFVVPTYFTTGSKPFPPSIQARLDGGSPELKHNFVHLGGVGAFKTASGVKIAFVGGGSAAAAASGDGGMESELEALAIHPLMPSPASPSSSSGSSTLSASRARQVSHQQGVDLLLLHDAPPKIDAPSSSAAGHQPSTSTSSRLAEIIVQARPRYMLWSSQDDGGFWERAPFGWSGSAAASTGSAEERFTRVIRLDRMGGADGAATKPKFYYAFTLPAQTHAIPPRPAGCTTNPYTSDSAAAAAAAAARGTKRPVLEDQNFIFAQQAPKKSRGEGGDGAASAAAAVPTGPVPTGYVCRICNEPGHWIQACPQREAADAARGGKSGGSSSEYVCRICGGKDHKIHDCPDKGKNKGMAGADGATPPEGYACKICGSGEHFIRECPNKDAGRVDARPPDSYACRGCGMTGQHWRRECPTHPPAAVTGATAPATELSSDECWFCLSNKDLEKKLIVHIGDECYVAMAKGQLIPTQGKHASSVVPGGGHVLILPIAHVQNPKLLKSEEALPLLNEIEKVKTAITETYASFGAVPVFFDLTRYSRRGGHYHIQSVPVPNAQADRIEKIFTEVAASSGVEWEADADETMRKIGNKQYFRVDLPDGKKLVHLIRAGNFNMQFGRMVLANLLDLGNRLNWQNCPESLDKQYQDAAAFKKNLGAHMSS